MQSLDSAPQLTADVNGHPHVSAHPTVGHVMPAWVLLGVFAALMVLTFLTVAATWLPPAITFSGFVIDLESWGLLIALGIATVKASLVALYFMHLRYDHPFHGLIFVAALVFVSLFLGLTILDSAAYQPDVQTYQQDTRTDG